MKKKIFGIQPTNLSYDEFINSSISIRGGYSCFVNSHMLYEHHTNPAFSGVMDNAKYLLPDGVPLLYSVRLFGKNKQERIAGNDVFFSLIDKAKSERLKVFVIGSTDKVLAKISSRLSVAGILHKTYSPPFKPIEDFDFDGQAEIINEFNPDLVLVGLGCPKQEIWMYSMREKVNASMYGLGGAFLLYAGVDTRAPLIVRKLAMEWLYRLILEPRRLFRRYLITNTYFCYLFAREVLTRIFFR